MQLYLVDAFTSVAFKGNPAGVWVGQAFPDEGLMQALAAEINASETAFVEHAGDRFRIRYFTPASEVPLCGHATLAGAHILRELRLVAEGAAFTLQAAAADLRVVVADGWVTMSLPEYGLTPIDAPGYLEAIIGAPVREAFQSADNWIVARLPDEQSLLAARPDFPAIAKNNIGLLIAATAASSHPDFEYSVRVFCNPEFGILEDPVTGSAQCILAPYWRGQLRKTAFRCRQLSQRGGEMQVRTEHGAVSIMGRAITVFSMRLAHEAQP